MGLRGDVGTQGFQELLCPATSDWLAPKGQERVKRGDREAQESPTLGVGSRLYPDTLGQGILGMEPLSPQSLRAELSYPGPGSPLYPP